MQALLPEIKVNGSFDCRGRDSYWWNTSEYDSSNACFRNIRCSGEYLNMGDYNKLYGCSVRLLKDKEKAVAN
ncbi:MAG TPA: hypothetical protein VHO70_08700 [Chitinispirillaceae bacterium]|nr:hypothetical protein [Chitinispirillaceae bacterium]